MKININILPALFALLLLAITACSVSPHEEPDASQELQGPGLLTGSKGEHSLSDFFPKESKAKITQEPQSYRDINIPAIDEQSFKDYENFKAWRRSQEPGSENYQEYQDWLAYQAYRRLKTQQEQSKP